jgi:hypothetical protein
MALWKILVCGVIRLDLNEDYDRLYELVNHHDLIRQMLGHGEYDKTPKTNLIHPKNQCHFRLLRFRRSFTPNQTDCYSKLSRICV